MKTATPDGMRSLFAALVVAALAGCTATPDPDGPKIVVDGDKYITLDAPVGSHMKRRIRVSESRQPTIQRTEKTVVTEETDTTLNPPTAGEMERMIREQNSAGGGGRP